MKISVVIPTLNEESNLERAIRSVSFADEVVVADGHSTDRTQSLARNLGATVVTAKRGRGNQLRAGAAEASGDILLFLHADGWLGKDSGQELRSHIATRMRTEQAQVFGCFRQAIDDQGLRFRLIEIGNAFRARWLGTPYGDQAIFVDRQSYIRAGGFDEVPLMEDVMLCRRLLRESRPTLLQGPVHVSARRWQKDGVLRRTLRNWTVLAGFACGVSPTRLAKWYQ